MCRWRRVRNIYNCGHAINLPDEEIRCDSHVCRFSPLHPPDCRPPTCRQTCWQYHVYPQLYCPHIARPCPECEANGFVNRK